MVTKEQMVEYLQKMIGTVKMLEGRNVPTKYLEEKIGEVLACKAMVEALTGEAIHIEF